MFVQFCLPVSHLVCFCVCCPVPMSFTDSALSPTTTTDCCAQLVMIIWCTGDGKGNGGSSSSSTNCLPRCRAVATHSQSILTDGCSVFEWRDISFSPITCPFPTLSEDGCCCCCCCEWIGSSLSLCTTESVVCLCACVRIHCPGAGENITALPLNRCRAVIFTLNLKVV